MQSDSSDPHTKVSQEEWPITGERTLDDIVKALQKAYDRPGNVTVATIQDGSVFVERTLSEEDELHAIDGMEEVLSSWEFVLNYAAVVDYGTAVEGFLQQLMEMFWIVKVEGLEVNRILVPSIQAFATALEVPPGLNVGKSFLGVPVEEEPELPSHVIIVCGAPSRLSPTREIRIALKGELS